MANVAVDCFRLRGRGVTIRPRLFAFLVVARIQQAASKDNEVVF